MSNYFIDIIDTTDGSHVLVQENAKASGVVLNWKGGDQKDDLTLLGSSLTMALQAPNKSMGYYLHLFTGDEQKYRVELRNDQVGVFGPELTVNGTFQDSTAGWRSLSVSLLSIASNQLKIHDSKFSDPIAGQTIATVIGKEYTVEIVTGNLINSDNFEFIVGEEPKGSELLNILNIPEFSAASGSFIATSNSTEIGIIVKTVGIAAYGLVESVSVKEVLEDNALIWQGYLLPDTYQEPYTNNVPFVTISAVDGLGRLKGKYLPDSYYTQDVSVIDIIQACLEQTGLEMPLRFAAAIQHITFSKYHTIFIDGTLLVEKDKKQTCYKILEDLLESMMCMVYQSYGYWYVEGYNVRHLSKVVYDEYGFNNTYVGEIETSRRLKVIEKETFATPIVSMVPVYKKVVVEYDIEQPKLSDTITQEVNDGWASDMYEFIVADSFFPHNGNSIAIADAYSKYKVRFTSFTGAADYMSLITPVYVNPGQEVVIEIDLSHSVIPEHNTLTTMKVEILHNGVVLNETNLYNNPDIEEDDEKRFTAFKYAFPVVTSGYVDVYFYQPVYTGRRTQLYDGWQLDKFEVTVVNQPELFLVEDVINDEYTTEKEVDLSYSDEFSSENKTFLLENLSANTTDTYQQPITVYNEFVSNNKRYIQVQLLDANLCDSFKDGLYVGASQIVVLDVIYNWLGSRDEHMVEIASEIGAGAPYVLFSKKYNPGVDRSTWQSWTDAVYKIENERYGKVVSNIYRRMFAEPYEKIDCSAAKMIMFNDLLIFNYIDQRRYVPTNLSIDLDTGVSTVSMVLNYYDDNSGGVSTNISPILNVMDNLCIAADGAIVYLTATAYDPDGFIVSAGWEIIQGAGTDTFLINENITEDGDVNCRAYILPLDQDEFIFRCTVEDNGGAIVSKDVTICRIISENIQAVYACGAVVLNESVPPLSSSVLGTSYRKGVDFSFLNTVSADYNFNVKIKVTALLCSALTLDDPLDVSCSTIYTISDSRLWRLYGGGARVFKNGLSVGVFQLYHPDRLDAGFIEFSMNPSDTILILIFGYKSGTTYMNTKLKVESIKEINDAIEVSNEGLEFYLTTNYTLQ